MYYVVKDDHCWWATVILRFFYIDVGIDERG